MYWYFRAFQKFGEFSGRARRKEYWMFILFNLIFSLAAIVLDSELNSPGVAFLFYSFFTFLPHLALTIRRLHDVGKSGWFVLILLIPFVGVIGILAQALKRGDVGDNQYGSDPKQEMYNLTQS